MKRSIVILIVGSGMLLAAMLSNGCASTKLTERGGAQLWSENCVRCHSTPPPTAYTSAQWEVVDMHMRVRGGLTAEESAKVTEFLKSAAN